MGWVNRFMHQCGYPKQKCLLTTSEIKTARKIYMIREQSKTENSERFQHDQKCLNLVRNVVGIYECRGRIYLPKKLITNSYQENRGGMANVMV